MMAKKSEIDEDCEQLSVVADPWNLKLRELFRIQNGAYQVFLNLVLLGGMGTSICK